jgi:hypothetical protein
LQDGQREAGNTIEIFLGIRYMQTLRNEPMAEPKRKAIP